MDLIMKQMPVVVSALNVGFLQTLKLFIVTLIGALPLGLVIAFGSMSHFKPLSWLARLIVWVIRGTPLMIQLLIIYYFPRAGLLQLTRSGVVVKQDDSLQQPYLYHQLRLLFFRNLPRWNPGCSGRSERSRSCTWHDKASDLFQDHTPSDDQTHRTTDVK